MPSFPSGGSRGQRLSDKSSHYHPTQILTINFIFKNSCMCACQAVLYPGVSEASGGGFPAAGVTAM